MTEQPCTLLFPQRDPHQPEFLAAVHEVASSLEPVFQRRPELLPIFAQLCEPERQVGAARLLARDRPGQDRLGRRAA